MSAKLLPIHIYFPIAFLTRSVISEYHFFSNFWGSRKINAIIFKIVAYLFGGK